jgi:DHA2 family multidrug resistance protein
MHYLARRMRRLHPRAVRFTQTERGRSAVLLAFTVAMGMELWTGSGMSLVLPFLTGTLSASADEASWLITVYATAFAVSIAMSHRLASYFGNRNYLVTSCLTYAVTSLGCALSPWLALMLVLRAVQGFAGGAFLVRTIVFFRHDYNQPRERLRASLIFCGLMYIPGRVIGPIVSGYMTDTIGWQWMFIPTAVAMTICAWVFHRYTAERIKGDTEKIRFDFPGFFLLLAGMSSLQVVLSRGEVDDWFESPFICISTIAAIFGFALFAAWQMMRANRHPLLDLHQLRFNRAVLGSTVVGVAIGALLGGPLYVLPQFLRVLGRHSATQTGCLLAINGAAAAILFGLPQARTWMLRIGGRLGLALILLTQAAAMLLFAHYMTSDTPDYDLWLPLILFGVYMSVGFPAVVTWAYRRSRAHFASNGFALYFGSRQVGMTIGVALSTILIDRRMALHSARLEEAFYARNTAVLGYVPGLSSPSALLHLAGAIRQQALALAYADVFVVMAVLSLATILFLPLLPPRNQAVRPRRSLRVADNIAAGLPDSGTLDGRGTLVNVSL